MHHEFHFTIVCMQNSVLHGKCKFDREWFKPTIWLKLNELRVYFLEMVPQGRDDNIISSDKIVIVALIRDWFSRSFEW